MALADYPIIELDSIDSTNNYAMRLIDANTAQIGMTITAQNQLAGKGQRGKVWLDVPGESLIMSVIVAPNRSIQEQFVFSASVAVVIAKVLQKRMGEVSVQIKWPNDIIVNDKKAGGVLIENVLRGSRWTHSVIGLGLNVTQRIFPDDLPYATSLFAATHADFEIAGLCKEISTAIIESMNQTNVATDVLKDYNQLLYRNGKQQRFGDGGSKWEAQLMGANLDGTLAVRTAAGEIAHYQHGQVLWEWA